MLYIRTFALLVALTLLGAPTSYQRPFSIAPKAASDWPSKGAALSVLTYNIKGLPWPIAQGRLPAIAAIGQRLSLMRTRGVQPHIVLVQEAFTDEAKKLAKVAGYDFVATGPSAASDAVQPPLGMKFDGAARWAKGERTGSLADSGLLVLSDYPIVKTLRFAFPEGACAGFDCLAAKGVLVAWIAVPGAREPIAFVNTHLNSRRAAHVPKARSDTAYAWQISTVRNFLMREISPNAAVIIGGDLNIGKSPNRRAAYSALPLLGPSQIDGLSSAKIMRVSTPEAEHIAVLNKDKIISRSGKNMTLTPVRAWVPFEKSTIDEPLSDHAGFVVDYRFTG